MTEKQFFLSRWWTLLKSSFSAAMEKPRPAWLSIAFAITTLIICLVSVYLVDIRNVLSLPYEIRRHEGLYFYLFSDLLLIQLIQAGFLAVIALSGACLYGIFRGPEKIKEHKFWGLVTLSFLLLLIEDVANPRHAIVHYASMINIPREAIEGPFYFLIALPLLIALLRYREVIFSNPRVKKYVIVGVSIYAFAVGLSLFREIGIEFYHIWGTKLSNIVTGGVIPGYGLMDLIVEESLELIAASTIFAGVYAYWKSVNASKFINKRTTTQQVEKSSCPEEL